MRMARGKSAFLLFCKLCSACCVFALHADEPDWEIGFGGVYSTAWRSLPASRAYNSINAENQFFDFGGRVARRLGPGFLGAKLGVYSSFALSEDIDASNYYGTTYPTVRSAEIGSAVNFTGGSYRLALQWLALQSSYRMYFYEIVFLEPGLGVAYGFGAIESTINGDSALGVQTEHLQYRYAEWGGILSAHTGVAIPIGTNQRLEFGFEFAYLFARFRQPDIHQQGSYTLSQTFYRPGIALTLKF